MHRQHFTATEVATAITETRGLISYAARRLGCTPKTVKNYIKRYDAVRAAAFEAREAMHDRAEYELIRLIEAGDVKAIIFYLSRHGRDRGYGMTTTHRVERYLATRHDQQVAKEPSADVVDAPGFQAALLEATGGAGAMPSAARFSLSAGDDDDFEPVTADDWGIR